MQLKSESFYPSTNCQTFVHHIAQLSMVPCQIWVTRAEVYFHPILLGCVLKTCQSQRVQTQWSSITNPLFASHTPISTSYFASRLRKYILYFSKSGSIVCLCALIYQIFMHKIVCFIFQKSCDGGGLGHVHLLVPTYLMPKYILMYTCLKVAS